MTIHPDTQQHLTIILPMPHRDNRDRLITAFIAQNNITNLSAIRQPDDIFTKHIIDSLAIELVCHAGYIDETAAHHLLDVGTGGGFPLLPIAQMYSHRSCHGLDARRKKIHAVSQIATETCISNISLHRSRIEEHNHTYDIVTARAVAHVTRLIPLIMGCCKKGGYIILYKQYSKDESDTLCAICNNTPSLHHIDTIFYQLPHHHQRTTHHTPHTQQRCLYLIRRT